MTGTLNSVLFPTAPNSRHLGNERLFNLTPLSNLSAEDRRKFVLFGRGPQNTPAFTTLHRAFEYHATTRPHAVAAMHGGRSISYSDLNEKAEKLATVLLQAGVKSGDSIGVFLTRSIPMLVGMFACLKIGANYVPQHAGVVPKTQLEHITNLTRMKVVLTLSEHLSDMPELPNVRLIALDELMKSFEFRALPTSGRRPANTNDTCFILFTSGTTGTPNGVQVTHKNVCNIVLTAPGNLGIKPGSRVAQLLSISFDMSAWEIYGALCNGATLLIRDKIIEHTASNADVIIATPSVLASIDTSVCQDAKVVAVAGEPCPQPLAETWAEFCDFYNCCGPTETTIVNTMKRYAPGSPLTIGTPTPNNTVYILDENLAPCAIGDVGEMWAGGICVTKGYLANVTLSQQRYRTDPYLGDGHVMFRTRDLGRWTENGELEHHGRTDDQVKIKGFRVELDAISTMIERLPTCRQAVTLKVSDEHVVTFVAPEDVNEAHAKEHVSANLPYYCVPTKIMAFEELPMTSRGKVDKRKLLDLYQASLREKAPTAQTQPLTPRSDEVEGEQHS
ncbi:AMP-binding protein [Enterovibrio norvegicus]|uniref:AMP-binding protein n=1 Tax=Enterovibrio norvegicus TaxID=188144 RepID=UPI000C85223C|nr:AMP-binding protein [Enterovibrio norvegicus]PML82101.1 peptide synthetase [Enterovibrio norvegicus]